LRIVKFAAAHAENSCVVQTFLSFGESDIFLKSPIIFMK